MFSNNEIFVCFVDYNENGITTLQHGGVPLGTWKSYYHETIDNIQIAWREKKYLTRRIYKIRRNTPCPCGSKKNIRTVVVKKLNNLFEKNLKLVYLSIEK